MMALSNIFYSMSTSTKQTGPTNVSRNPVRTQSVLERMEDSLVKETYLEIRSLLSSY